MPLPRTHRSASIFSRGSSYDRQTPKADHDPTANLLNYEDISTGARSAGSPIHNALNKLAKVFGLTGVLDLIDGTPDGEFDPTAMLTNLANLLNPLNIFARFQDLDDLITGVVTGAVGGAVGGIADLIGKLLSFGTSSNPAIAALENRMAAVESVSSGDTGVHDHFNRASLNPASGSPDWIVLSAGAPPVIDGKFVWSSGNTHAIQHPVPFTTDRMSAAAAVVLDRSLMNGESGIWIGSPTAMVWLQFDRSIGGGDRLRLYGLTSYSSSGSQLDTYNPSHNLVTGDVIMLQYSPTDETWYGFLNNEAVLAWPDPANTVPVGVGHREHGLILNKTGNSSNRGSGLDDYSAFDYAA